MNLSPHFTLKEMTKSATATRLGIPNIPDSFQFKNLKRVAQEILEPVREHYKTPFSPTSGFRCPKLNKAIGGAANSQHTRGEAVDFEVPGIANQDLAEWILRNMGFDQLILEYYDPDIPDSGWVHVSVVPWDNRGEALIFDGRNYRPL